MSHRGTEVENTENTRNGLVFSVSFVSSVPLWLFEALFERLELLSQLRQLPF
jgi:hypothetical protein